MNRDLVEKTVHNNGTDAGGTVDMPNKHWFVAIVDNNTGKIYDEKLNLSYESYVPI